VLDMGEVWSRIVRPHLTHGVTLVTVRDTIPFLPAVLSRAPEMLCQCVRLFDGVRFASCSHGNLECQDKQLYHSVPCLLFSEPVKWIFLGGGGQLSFFLKNLLSSYDRIAL
jgi:hypothetical protein